MKRFAQFVRELPVREHISTAILVVLLFIGLAIFDAIGIWAGVDEHVRRVFMGVMSYFVLKPRMIELYAMWLRFNTKESA